MTTCKEYDNLHPDWKSEIERLIHKMKGKSNIAEIMVEKSDLKSYEFKVTVMKFNSKKGWATIGYIRHDMFKGSIWRLTYKPRLAKDEKSAAGRTGSYN